MKEEASHQRKIDLLRPGWVIYLLNRHHLYSKIVYEAQITHGDGQWFTENSDTALSSSAVLAPRALVRVSRAERSESSTYGEGDRDTGAWAAIPVMPQGLNEARRPTLVY